MSVLWRFSSRNIPLLGIPRLDRYERALRHELDPPIRVLELINLYPNDREVTHW